MSEQPALHWIASVEAAERLRLSLVHWPADAAVLLLEDGVHAAHWLVDCLPVQQIFALQADAEWAGLDLLDGVQWLDDPQWLALLDRYPRSVCW